MKKIEAIIRKSKFKEVKSALINAGFEYFTYWLARDRGKEKETRFYRGVEYQTPSAERIWLELVVKDKQQSDVVSIILNNGKTGDVGDGRIFVTNIESAHLIRTGDSGDEILSIED